LMDSVPLFLLAVAGVLLVGTLGDLLFRRTGIPDAVWLIGAGCLLGPVLGTVKADQILPLSPYIAVLALVAALFDSGIRLRFTGAGGNARRAVPLAIAGFAGSALAVAAASMLAQSLNFLPMGWTWGHGLLLGSILGAAGSTVMVPSIVARTDRTVADTVELESASGEVLCVAGALALMEFMLSAQSSGQAGMSGFAGKVTWSFGTGLFCGVVAGLIWLLFLKVLRSVSQAYPVTLAVLLLLYVGVERIGGSAAFAILGVAAVLGNAPVIGRSLKLGEELKLGESVQGFQNQVAFIIRSFFFAYIGIMLGPPWSLAAVGAVLAIVLLAVRWLAVAVTPGKERLSAPQRRMLAACLPRGMTAGALALFPAIRGLAFAEVFSPVAFACVLASALIFAVAFPLAGRNSAPAYSAFPRVDIYPSVPAPPSEPQTPNAPAPAEPEIKPGTPFHW